MRARAAAAPTSGASNALTSAAPGSVVQLYRHHYLGATQLETLLHKAQSRVSGSVSGMDAELCYNIELSAPLTEQEAATLQWLLRETFEPECFSDQPFLSDSAAAPVVEVGPRLSFSTAWAGQISPPEQRRTASPSSRMASDPHSGHFVGNS